MSHHAVQRDGVFLALLMILATPSFLHAQEIQEIEPNTKLEEAQRITIPCVIRGTHSEYAEYDHYAFTVTETGKPLFVELSAEGDIDPKLALLDGYGGVLTESDFFKANREEHLTSLLLEPGTYYIRVFRALSRKQPGIPYTLIVDEPPDVTADEVNAALNKALD